MFQHLLVAIDGSESSLRAADVAIELAIHLGARLDILSVEETAPRYVATHEESTREHSAAIEYYDRVQTPVRKRAEQQGVQTRCAVLRGHEGQVILAYIKEQHCDLLILGHQGHSGVWGAFLGSTADKLVSHVPCSALVIRPKTSKALFKRLLVALDGSPLSLQAFHIALLPYRWQSYSEPHCIRFPSSKALSHHRQGVHPLLTQEPLQRKCNGTGEPTSSRFRPSL